MHNWLPLKQTWKKNSENLSLIVREETWLWVFFKYVGTFFSLRCHLGCKSFLPLIKRSREKTQWEFKFSHSKKQQKTKQQHQQQQKMVKHHGIILFLSYTVLKISRLFSFLLRPEMDTEWTYIREPIETNSMVLKGLLPDTEYQFVVRAVNMHGVSPPSHINNPVRTLGKDRRWSLSQLHIKKQQ